MTELSGIGFDAFFLCSNLTSVVISSSINNIEEYEFDVCISLEELKFKGTKKQTIQSGIGNKSRKRWRKNSPIKKIICSDREINLK